MQVQCRRSFKTCPDYAKCLWCLKNFKGTKSGTHPSFVNPEVYKEDIAELCITTPKICANCMACITFGEKDLWLGLSMTIDHFML